MTPRPDRPSALPAIVEVVAAVEAPEARQVARARPWLLVVTEDSALLDCSRVTFFVAVSAAVVVVAACCLPCFVQMGDSWRLTLRQARPSGPAAETGRLRSADATHPS